jgi:hypothetical protein
MTVPSLRIRARLEIDERDVKCTRQTLAVEIAQPEATVTQLSISLDVIVQLA